MTVRERLEAAYLQMPEGHEERRAALLASLTALPIETDNHWELFTLMLWDFDQILKSPPHGGTQRGHSLFLPPVPFL